MYSGIIQGHYPVTQIQQRPGLMSFAVRFPNDLMQSLRQGASIAVDGVCQTVRLIDESEIWFDAMQETLDKTTLSQLQVGQYVNIERSLHYGDENGGHELSGHIDGTLTITQITNSEHNYVMTLEVPKNFRNYVFNKGFLAIHGASLTVSDWNVSEGTFKIYLIPETLRLTNLRQFKTGDQLNFEVDRRTQVIVDTVERYLAQHPTLNQ
ncbi:riboflavin synthase subunit alpha [Celerinatantimonas sp. YJH-8]|uniref:riboflavin synthase subunit alpha n=1 Tax=Celerinatantimonas sp. YJH-8 TaxID=3228714 RepID=UPI0038C44768